MRAKGSKVWHLDGIRGKAQAEFFVLFKNNVQFVELHLKHPDVVRVFVSLVLQFLDFAGKLVLSLAFLFTIHRRRGNSRWYDCDGSFYNRFQWCLGLVRDVLQSVLAVALLHCLNEYLGL